MTYLRRKDKATNNLPSYLWLFCQCHLAHPDTAAVAVLSAQSLPQGAWKPNKGKVISSQSLWRKCLMKHLLECSRHINSKKHSIKQRVFPHSTWYLAQCLSVSIWPGLTSKHTIWLSSLQGAGLHSLHKPKETTKKLNPNSWCFSCRSVTAVVKRNTCKRHWEVSIIVIRGDWLWKAANTRDKNNSAADYVGSSLTVHNPLFWTSILKDCIKVQEKKRKVVAFCSRPRQNVKLGSFTL